MGIIKRISKQIIRDVIKPILSDGDIMPPAGYCFVINKFGNYIIDKNGKRLIARKP